MWSYPGFGDGPASPPCADGRGRRRMAEDLAGLRAQLAALQECLADGWYSLDREWRLLTVSPFAASEIFGAEPAALVGRLVWDVLPSFRDGDRHRAFAAAWAAQRPLKLEGEGLRHPGRWFEVSALPAADRLDVYVRDVTARRQAETEAWRAAAEIEFLHGVVLRLNAAGPDDDVFRMLAEEVGRLDPEALVFGSAFDAARQTVTVRAAVGTPERLAVLREAISGSLVGLALPVPAEAIAELEGGRLVRLTGGLFELTFGQLPAALCRATEERLGVGGVHVVALTFGSEYLGTIALVTRTPDPPVRAPLIETLVRQAALAIRQRVAMAAAQEAERGLRDLTATLEQRVAERTRGLRTLAAQLVETEQRERNRIAQVLHDQLQQLLVAAKMRAASAARRTPDGATARLLAQVQELLDDSLRESRTLTVELSPPVLRERGLLPALRWLARWMEEKHGLAVRLDLEPVAEVNDEAARLALFGAARELLLNVVKHAGVEVAALALRRQGGSVRLEVADDGRGFSPDRLGPPDAVTRGLGFVAVADRLDLLGGRVDIDSAPGAGTRIVMTVPADPAPAPAAP